MGVLHDLILADEDDLEKILSFAQFSDADVISTKILDPVTFAQLHAILLVTEYESIADLYLNPIAEGGEDGPWITLVPPEFVAKLAQLEAAEFQRVALEWAATEEITIWKFQNIASFVHALLTDMQNLAQRALTTNKKLFLRSAL
jgi:hypothetical protein